MTLYAMFNVLIVITKNFFDKQKALCIPYMKFQSILTIIFPLIVLNLPNLLHPADVSSLAWQHTLLDKLLDTVQEHRRVRLN